MSKKYKSKRYKALIEKIPTEAISLEKALSIVKDNSKSSKFDETVEIVIKVNLDPKRQSIKTAADLPAGTGKKIKIAAFVKGNNVDIAKGLGIEECDSDKLISDIKAGQINFDVCVATPDMMKEVSKVAMQLGPRKLMPTPKAGTVGTDVKAMIEAMQKGRVKLALEKSGALVQAMVGKSSFDTEDLKKNVISIFDAVIKAKPEDFKGATYIKSCHISSTMTPSVKVDFSEIL